MIQQLSDFLRGTLKKEEYQSILLQEEMDYVQLYLEIEKVRFGHRLQTVVSIESEALEKLLPAFILQPIVENAIKFGLYDTTEDVTIHITANLVNQQLNLCVSNPFDETTAMGGRGTGFGLASIQRRLFLLYGRNDLLKTESVGSTFYCTITIPTFET
jgi:two-component system LytT family sensor kinase